MKQYTIIFNYWSGNRVYHKAEIFEAESKEGALDQLYKKYRIYILESIREN